jgi:hypothetical protein
MSDQYEENEKDEKIGECETCAGTTVNGHCAECLFLSSIDLTAQIKELEEEIEDSENDPFENGLVTDAYEDAEVLCKVFEEEDQTKIQEKIRKWLREKKKDDQGKDKATVSRSIQMVSSAGNRLYIFYLEDKSD